MGPFNLSCASFRAVLSAATCGVTLLAGVSPSVAYHPDSPEVLEIVNKAVVYLEKDGITDSHFGGKCLIGMALLKADKPEDHPKVLAAVEACREVIGATEKTDDIYSLGISIIFLCELDPSRYRQEIISLLEILNGYQKPFGGWGYVEGPHLSTGDTSMTQYAVLAQWSAYRNGVIAEFPGKRVGAVCNWLMRTQDPSGGWGYQGVDPGSFQRTAQRQLRHSLCAAGLSSVYVCADMLGFGGLDPRTESVDGVPGVLTEVGQEQPTRRRRTGLVDSGVIKRAMFDGDKWFAANYKIDVDAWACYYLYGFERYQSFKELHDGTSELEPAWYNDGVRYFEKKQNPSGSFYGQCPEPVATAFAVLFLRRSTKRSIQKSIDKFGGILAGGRGLPSSSKGVELKNGRIAPSPFQGEVDSLLSVLERADAAELEAISDEIDVQLARDPQRRAQQLARLERLARASDHHVRFAAIRAISSARSMDSVPTLIFALSDPNRRIVREARNGLRFLSRDFDGFGLPDQFTLAEQLEAIAAWKAWYLAIRPEAQFLN